MKKIREKGGEAVTDESKGPSDWAYEHARAITEPHSTIDAPFVRMLAVLFDALRESARAAGRLEERDRAARVCEAVSKTWPPFDGCRIAIRRCIEAIRREPDADGE